ncbi:MAG: triphosphoribosyl-dephospho-CoA synthase MdcB [Burkholderiales bacterium]
MHTASPTLRRHHWAWLKPEAVLEDAGVSAPDRTFLQDWVSSGRPLVVARSSVDGEVRLGVTRPALGPRHRVGVTVAPEAVLRAMPALSLMAVLAHAPSTWQPTLQALCVIGARYATDIRVYGSLALQYFATQPCLNPDSDLDLLLEIEDETVIDSLLAELEVLQAQYPVPRMDGEMRMGEWAVAWRELSVVRRRPGWLIAKSDRAVALKKGDRPHQRGLSPIALAAVRALHQELLLHPKPGLVSLQDNGAHTDMTPVTFLRSLFSLRGYFARIAEAGRAGASFDDLRALGVVAEARMLRATRGVNTHRGAIFNLGLLAAAAGACPAAAAETLCGTVGQRWGEAILLTADTAPVEGSHGSWVAHQHGIRGARWQAAQGFPALTQLGLPAYRTALQDTGELRRAALSAFFAIMASLEDSNLVWRGGLAGLHFAQAEAATFLARGGVLQEDWEAQATAIHQRMVARRLSPGGSADLLAALLLVVALEHL